MSALEDRLARIESSDERNDAVDVPWLIATVRALVNGMLLMYRDERDKVIADVEKGAS